MAGEDGWRAGRACRVVGHAGPELCTLCPVRWDCLYTALRGRSSDPRRGGLDRYHRAELLRRAGGDAREALVAAWHLSEQGIGWPRGRT